MKRLRRFVRLSATEQWLLLKAALLLVVIRVGLWFVPFQALRRLLTRAVDIQVGPWWPKQISVERVAWAVEVASRYTPGFRTCLTQALATQVLLARRDHPALVRIGVARGEGDKFEAHAWVESEGKVVIGGHDLERYTRLAALEGETP